MNKKVQRVFTTAYGGNSANRQEQQETILVVGVRTVRKGLPFSDPVLHPNTFEYGPDSGVISIEY